MEEKQAKRAVLEGARRLVASALIARTWGNISCRVGSTHFVITPSGRDYATLDESQLVLVRLDDLSYEGSIKPSSEKGIHRAVYRQRAEVNCIIHTHQEMASLASQLGSPLAVPPAFQAILGQSIFTAGYALPGTKRLQAQVSSVLQTEHQAALLMARHGALCFGTEMDATYAIADALEAVCTEAVHTRAPLLRTFGEPPSPTVVARKTKSGVVEGSGGELQALYNALLQNKSGYTHILLLSSREILTCMKHIPTLAAYLDDVAQIAGPTLKVMQRDSRLSALLSAAKGRDALLIDGIGALCMGKTKSDAQAVATLLQKNCKAALLALSSPSVRPLPWLDTRLMRFVYTHTYSKLTAALD